MYSENRVLFPTDIDTRVVGMWVDRVPSGYEKEWILAASLNELKEVQVLLVFQTNEINYWGYSLEAYL